MTEEQLQLLRAARPSGQDEHDADVAAARAAAAHDPEALARLEEERQIDLAMQESLRATEPPAGLEASLLAAMRTARAAAASPAPEPKFKIVELPASESHTARISRRGWLAASAAAAASVALGSIWWWREYRAFSMKRLSAALADITKKGVTLSLMSMDKTAVVNWLIDNHAPRADALPEKLDALGRKGCHIYDIEGHPVSLECMLLPGMVEIHLFATRSENLVDPPAPGAPAKVATFSGRTLATWTRGAQTMLLFSQAPTNTIAGLV